MPVCPKTPGAIAATERRASRPVECAISPLMCLVANMDLIVFGPNASGVIDSLPSPTTKIVPSCGSK